MKRRHHQSRFGSTSGRFPRARVEVGGDGYMWIVICRSRNEYTERNGEKPVRFGLSIAGARKLLNALRGAVPAARKAAKRRSYRRVKHGI